MVAWNEERPGAPSSTGDASDARAGMMQNLLFSPRWFTFIQYFAFEETRRQYKRTVLGPLWVVLTQFVIVFAIGFVYSSVFKQKPEEFFPHLSASIVSWNFLSSVITAAPNTLVMNALTMKAFAMPTSVFTAQMVARNFVQYGHALLIHAVVIVLFKMSLGPWLLLFPITLALTVAFLYPLAVALAIWGARFRDVIPMISSTMYLMFLITPVLWMPSLLGSERAYIIEFNPLFYPLDALRQPLLAQPLHPFTPWAMLGLIALSWGLAFSSAAFARRNAVFWV